MPPESASGTVTSASKIPLAVAVRVVAVSSSTGLGLALKVMLWSRPSSVMVTFAESGVAVDRLSGSGEPKLTVNSSLAVSWSRIVLMVAVAEVAPAATSMLAGASHSAASAALVPEPATVIGMVVLTAKARSRVTVIVTGSPLSTAAALLLSVASTPLPSSSMLTVTESGSPAARPSGRVPRASLTVSASLSASRWVMSSVVPVFSPAVMVMLAGAS